MIITSKDFEVKTPEWVTDPNLPEGLKAQFRADGLAEPLNGLELCQIEDDCFVCGRKLTAPYVYWDGCNKGISLCQTCAPRLALGLAEDAYELASALRSKAKTDATDWLGTYAQRRENGLE
jgi:hypothetical protein